MSDIPARLHGGNLWRLSRQTGLPRAQLLDFSVDVNPLGCPPRVRAVLLAHLDEIQSYPDPEAVALREVLAAVHQVSTDAILPANGSAELIGLVTEARPLRQAVVVVPTFTEYEWALARRGVAVTHFVTHESNGFQLDHSRDPWAPLLREAKLVFLCNPNNPTGVALRKEQVLELAAWCREAGAWLVVDEAFVDFVEDPAAISVLPEAPRWPNVIVLRSLTKLFAVPGLRLGFAVAGPELIRTLRALQPPWPLNTFALAVGVELLHEAEYVTRTRRQVARWRTQLQAQLQSVPGVHVFPSTVNFLLCKLTTPALTSGDLAEALARRGLLIRSCDDFTEFAPGRFVRIAVKTPEAHRRLLHALHALHPSLVPA